MLEAKVASYEDRVRLAFVVDGRCFAIHAVEVEPSHVGMVLSQFRAGCAVLGIPMEGVPPAEFPELAEARA